MNMNTEIIYKLLKYLGQGIIIYFLFKYVPKEPMSDRDILLITTIVILACAVLENITLLYNKNNLVTSGVATQCNAKCTIKEEQTEHMSETTMANSSIITTEEIKQHVQEQIDKQIKEQIDKQVEQIKEQIKELKQEPIIQSIPKPSVEYNSEPDITQKGTKRNPDGSYTITPVKNSQSTATSSRATDDVMGSEMAYNYTDYNTLPVSTSWDSWENGASYLPPSQWFPVPPHPPVCVAEKVCPVCPVFTNGTDVTLKEWNQTRRISPPDNINVKYIEDKLNSGR